MEFDNNKPIYLQISDKLSEDILEGNVTPGSRIPSVREYSAEIGVNPNTVARAYEKMTDEGIIFNKRGIGFFVSEKARDEVLAAQRKDFLENELPRIKKKMELLELNIKNYL